MKTTRESKAHGLARLFTPGWIFLHVLALLLVPAFFWLGYWQLSRAQAGNTISWAYSLEWPIFAIFTLVLWIRQIRIELRSGPAGEEISSPGQSGITGDKEAAPPMRSPWERDIIAAREQEGSV